MMQMLLLVVVVEVVEVRMCLLLMVHVSRATGFSIKVMKGRRWWACEIWASYGTCDVSGGLLLLLLGEGWNEAGAKELPQLLHQYIQLEWQ